MPLVSVLYFAQAQERTGLAVERLDLVGETSVDAVFAVLAARHPPLAPLLPRCRLAVDHAFAHGALRLSETSEIAVIPPVSGG